MNDRFLILSRASFGAVVAGMLAVSDFIPTTVVMMLLGAGGMLVLPLRSKVEMRRQDLGGYGVLMAGLISLGPPGVYNWTWLWMAAGSLIALGLPYLLGTNEPKGGNDNAG